MKPHSRFSPSVKPTDSFFLLCGSLLFLFLFSIYFTVLFWASILLMITLAAFATMEYRSISNVALDQVTVSLPKRLFLFSQAPLEVILSVSGGKLTKPLCQLFFNDTWSTTNSQTPLMHDAATKTWKASFQMQPIKLGHFSVPFMRATVLSERQFFKLTWSIDSNQQVDVFPPNRKMDPDELWKLLSAQSFLNIGQLHLRMAQVGDAFHSIREYRPFDSIRNVDAKKSSQLRKPMVRTYEKNEQQHVHFVLDIGRSMIGKIGDSFKFDFYLLACIKMAEYAEQLKDRFSFSCLGEDFTTYISRSTNAAKLLKLFRQGGLSPVQEETNYSSLLMALASQGEASTVIFFSDLMKPSNRAQALRFVPHFPQKHRFTFVHLLESKYHLFTKLRNESRGLGQREIGEYLYAYNLELEKRIFLAKLQRYRANLLSFDELTWLGALTQIYPSLRFQR